VAVVMVHAYGWPREETAAMMLEVSVSTLDTHVQRGLAKLRDTLGVESHV
jgi:DNA-directed RNA polymerase specialized sigma24 family protein